MGFINVTGSHNLIHVYSNLLGPSVSFQYLVRALLQELCI